MSLDREKVAAALFAALQARAGVGFKTVTRRYVPIDQVDTTLMPWLCQSYAGERRIEPIRRGAPNGWRLTYVLSIYNCADSTDENASPSTQQLALVKAVEDALERPATERPNDMSELYSTTLGLPNVNQCRLLSVETDEGWLTPKGWAVLVVEIDAAFP